MKPPRLFRGDRCANDAGGVADDERHLLRRAKRRRDEEIALVLAVVVIGNDDKLAARKGGYGSPDALVGVAHRVAVAMPSARRVMAVNAKPSNFVAPKLACFAA